MIASNTNWNSPIAEEIEHQRRHGIQRQIHEGLLKRPFA